MHKKLFKCGNGMAMIVDASMRRFLGIDENTLLHVTREGRRIVIEKSACDRPTAVDPVLLTATTYNHRLLNELFYEFDRRGMDRERFLRLSHDGRALFSVHATVSSGGPVDAVTAARLERCFKKIRGGMRFEPAIEETLAELPCVPEPVQLTATA